MYKVTYLKDDLIDFYTRTMTAWKFQNRRNIVNLADLSALYGEKRRTIWI